MYRKIELLLILFYISFYIFSYIGRLSFNLLLCEDFVWPMLAFYIGDKLAAKEFRLFFKGTIYLIGAVSLAFLIRAFVPLNLDMSGTIISLINIFPYFIGSYIYVKKGKIAILFLLETFYTLIVLATPHIGIDYLIYLKTIKSTLLEQIKNYPEIFFSNQILGSLQYLIINSIDVWGFGLEVMSKLFIAFVLTKIYLSFSKRFDYKISLAFFHRNYGIVIVLFYLLFLVGYLVAPNEYIISAVLLTTFYFITTGIAYYLEWGRIHKNIKKSNLPTIIMLFWLFLLFFNSTTFLLSIMILIIYSVNVALKGKDNLNRLLLKNFGKLKEMNYGNNFKRKD